MPKHVLRLYFGYVMRLLFFAEPFYRRPSLDDMGRWKSRTIEENMHKKGRGGRAAQKCWLGSMLVWHLIAVFGSPAIWQWSAVECAMPRPTKKVEPPPGWDKKCQIGGCVHSVVKPEWDAKRVCWSNLDAYWIAERRAELMHACTQKFV